MAIFVPTKINVGFQERKGTYSGKLAYVIYFDQKCKLRKETSWQNWRDVTIPNEIYDNEPTEGFVLNKKVGGVEESYCYDVRKTYIRVYDPRGFEFEITVPNLLWILQNCDCTRGKGLEGQFVYGWDGTELVLVPVESPDYKDIVEKNDVIHNNTFIKAKELICGAIYEDLNGVKYVYMGKFQPWDKQYNSYHTASSYNNHKEGYDYPLDDSWKQSVFDEHRELPWYYRYTQRPKAEFFFIQLGNPDAEYSCYRNNSVAYMKSVNKKFAKCLAETTEYYLEYVDLLNRNASFSPVEYDTEQILSLPYENFEAAAISFIGQENRYKYSTLSFGINESGHIKKVSFYYDDKKAQFYKKYEVEEPYETTDWWGKKTTKTRTVNHNKYYESIKEMYAETNPVYGIQYLANGQEHERSYYYGTDE